MALTWHPIGLFGVAACVFTWIMAGVVYLSAPKRSPNRRLAVLLAVEGAAALTGSGLLYFADAAELAYSFQWTSTAAQLLLPPLYLFFLATLDTPLVRPLKTRAAELALFGIAIAAEAFFFVMPGEFVLGMAPAWYAEWESVQGPLWPVVIVSLLAVSLFGLAASVSAYKRAPPATSLRQRAKGFAIAFGTRDALLVATLLLPTTLSPLFPSRLWDLSGAISVAIVFLLYVPLIAYSILRHQLFDIDLKIKWTIERGTVATVFLAIYVIASQAAALLLVPTLGPWLGVAAVGILVFAIVPLQRLAERLSSAIMPAVADSPQYLEERKLEVYKAALEQAYGSGSGSVSKEEAALLTVFRQNLGISERDHAVLDFAVRSVVASGRTDAELARGTGMLGKFRVLEELAAGASGETFLAEDTLLGRRVVIKALRHGAGRRDAVLAEARRVAAIRHPNVVTIYEVEEVAGRAFLVMEYLEGGPLETRLRRGALRHEEFARVATGLLLALEAVHAAGLVHRDVKPSNILLTPTGEVKLADFGIAFAPELDATVGEGGSAGAMGTIRYMSPEQARGWLVTPRSDMFSAAVTLFEAYVGEPYLAPLPNESAMELQMRAGAGNPFKRDINGPRELAAWFEKALAPSPEERFGSAAEMRHGLEDILARIS